MVAPRDPVPGMVLALLVSIALAVLATCNDTIAMVMFAFGRRLLAIPYAIIAVAQAIARRPVRDQAATRLVPSCLSIAIAGDLVAAVAMPNLRPYHALGAAAAGLGLVVWRSAASRA